MTTNKKQKVLFCFLLFFVCFTLFTACENPFIESRKQEEIQNLNDSGSIITIGSNSGGGTVSIVGTYRIGETLSVITTGTNGKEAPFIYQWVADGAAIPGAVNKTYTLRGTDAGKIISCIISHESASNSVVAWGKRAPFNIDLEVRGNKAAGDTVILSGATGHIEDTITLNYHLASTALNNNLEFRNIGQVMTPVTTSGTGKSQYSVKMSDAINGVITIIAVFTHYNNTRPDPIAFNVQGINTVNYGDNNNSYTNTIRHSYLGNGAIRYSSDNAAVATVDVNGVVTIRKAGNVIISAEKDADIDYAYAFQSYNLIINPKPVTITGLDAVDKIYDGTSYASVTGIPIIDGKLADDNVIVNRGTAAFADINAGSNKTVIFNGWSLIGADASNYELIQPANVLANITKADPIINWPTGLTSAYGQLLSAISLSGNGTSTPAGTFSWTVPGTILLETSGSQTCSVTFTPNDTANYNIKTKNIIITVNTTHYIVTFDKNGGNTEASPATKTVTQPATTIDSLPTEPTRLHYAFTGWNTEPDGSGTTFNETTTVNPSITVYAQWRMVGFIAVSAGYGHTMAIKADGSLWAWGRNDYGQLGDGTTIDRSSPVRVQGMSSGIVAVSAGGYHTMAIKADGSVWAWGYNEYGQLGDGSTVNRRSPIRVQGMSPGVVAVSAGSNHSVALTLAGSVLAWGRNNYGQLGDNSNATRLVPTQVHGMSSGVVAVSAGDNHSMAITAIGGVHAWGSNGAGQLGDGGSATHLVPIQVLGMSSGIVAVSAGDSYTVARSSSGGVYAWGINSSGQLGDNSYTNRLVPTPVSGMNSGVVAVSAGGSHTLAIKADGSLWAWGNNNYGQLGRTGSNQNAPLQVPGMSSGVETVSAGNSHTMVIKEDGSLWAFGNNSYGQLGNGNTTNSSSPVQIPEPR